MMEGKRVRKTLFLVFFIALFLFVARLFFPFLTILLWSGLIYVFLEPLHRRATRRRDGTERAEPTKSVIAGAFAVFGILVIAVPALFLGIAVVRQAGELASSILKALDSRPELLDLSPKGPLGGLVARLSGGAIDLSSIDLKDEIKRFLAGQAGAIIGFSGTMLKDALGIILTLAFMVFTLFFFFVDGRHLAEIVVRAIPIERSYTSLFLRKLKETGRQLVLGNFTVALFQGSVMFILSLIFKIKAALLVACLTAIASFVPMIGTALVWLPISATLFLAGRTATALAFLALSSIFVATLDNFIRPVLLRERLKIHPLLIFFSILGGIRIFGFNGILLGPLVLMLFFAAAELFEQSYEREKEADSRRRRANGRAEEARPEGEAGKE